MKTLTSQTCSEFRNAEENEKFINQYRSLENGEHFIYADCSSRFFAVKINDDCGALINYRNRFIAFRAFSNLLSIGNFSVEYKEFDEESIIHSASLIK